MDWKQKEAAERRTRIAAARQWVTAQGHTDEGFSEWFSDTGQDLEGVGYADAHAAWMTSPARIERWAERNGIFIGKGFARWYLENKRTDSFAKAYELYRAVTLWNSAHPYGTPVRYWTGAREGAGQEGRTRSAASVLGGHTAVVWVTGHGACIALTHVQPIPETAANR